MGGLSYNKSRGGLQNRKVDGFTIYETLEERKTKAGGRKEFICETRKPRLTIHYCIGDLTEWFTAEFPYLSPWQIYLCHTPQTAAQDLRISSCTGEVFRHCKFKELTNNILPHSSCELCSLYQPKYLVLLGVGGGGGHFVRMTSSSGGEETSRDIWREAEWKAAISNQGSRDREKAGQIRRRGVSAHLNPLQQPLPLQQDWSRKVCLSVLYVMHSSIQDTAL